MQRKSFYTALKNNNVFSELHCVKGHTRESYKALGISARLRLRQAMRSIIAVKYKIP